MQNLLVNEEKGGAGEAKEEMSKNERTLINKLIQNSSNRKANADLFSVDP